MHREELGIYLNDHLAGSTLGEGLARRIAHRHRHSARRGDLERIADEVAEDRRALLDLMAALDVGARRYKVYGGLVAERLSRLKSNGRLYRRSGLSTVVELETLRLGVEGKALVWITLLAVAWSPRLRVPPTPPKYAPRSCVPCTYRVPLQDGRSSPLTERPHPPVALRL
ncbi:hypothetical protein [Streptomyces sp. ICBB 8177]|uniref:hypothetical protein n=1 Tax=Streptomyces sp. ICBB 8177 TaxID=563922 RepID=UPI000D67E32C|nr:hypothetical protein [Streptomyces sp. ICBB 8177]PWI40895.1 hypothetical protein CK485_26205 [Streptomyces sp. ICBB 8177]